MDQNSTVSLCTGNSMPVMGLGTWQLTNNTAETVEAALEMGYRLIDTSGDYGTQPGIGKGFRRSGLDRSDIYLVTKVEETDDGYEAVLKNLDELHMAFADLVLIHRPPSTVAGEVIWRGLIRAQEEGLAKDIGVSNYSEALIDALIDATGEIPAVNQIEWHPFGHSGNMLRYARSKEIVIQAYSPLTRTDRLDESALQDIAETYGKTPAQVVIRWNLQRGVVPLPKAGRKEHLWENIDIFNFEISQEDMARLDGLNEHYSAFESLPYV